jgi:hypothetical protein
VTFPDDVDEAGGTEAAGTEAAGTEAAGTDGMPFTPGSPTTGRVSGWTVSDGVGWIDTVDGMPFEGSRLSAARGARLRLRGWFFGDSGSSGRPGGRSYVTLTSEGARWHVPVAQRSARRDLQRGMLATGRRRRRLIRAIDRLPPGAAAFARHLLAGRRDRFGFESDLRMEALPAGVYQLGFLEETESGSYRVDTDVLVRVVA